MLMSELIVAVLPRIKGPSSGITIWQAANSIQSLIYKHLLDRKSELLASGNLALSIPAFGYYATLPDDFVAPAERPYTEELVSDWMAGTVTSYNNTTGALVVSVSLSSGTDTLAYWDIATGAVPGSPAANIGNSTTSLLCGTGSKSLTTQAGLGLTVEQYIILSSENAPAGWQGKYRTLEPNYLNNDEDDKGQSWWDWYGSVGMYGMLNTKPNVYKIIGSIIYIRPTPVVDLSLKGLYYQKPTALSLTTHSVPWDGKFDEIFIEGVVRIILKDVAIPDIDTDFMAFFNREFNTVINARARLIPKRGRTSRKNYM